LAHGAGAWLAREEQMRRVEKGMQFAFSTDESGESGRAFPQHPSAASCGVLFLTSDNNLLPPGGQT